MALTDAERMQMTTMATMQYNIISNRYQQYGLLPEEYEYPSDWIDISNPVSGTIHLLFRDDGNRIATTGLSCTTDSGDFRVDWGDGTIIDYTSGAYAQHTYIEGGGALCSRGYTTYKATISAVSGNLLSFQIRKDFLYYHSHSILACDMNAPSIISLNNAFDYGSSYTSFLEYFNCSNMSNVLSAQSMFLNCYALQYANINSFTSVTDASHMFNNCSSLQEIDISGMSNLSDATGMFYNCFSLVSINLPPNPVIEYASYMFYNVPLRTIDLTSWSLLKDADHMFEYCRLLTSAIISNLSLLYDTSAMFYYCNNLKTVEADNLTAVITADSMFCYCSSLSEISIQGMSTNKDGDNMFCGCFLLYQIDISDMVLLETAYRMFYSCYQLQTINCNNFTLLKDARSMFSNCISLDNINMTNCGSSSSYLDLQDAFDNCYSLTSLSIPNANLYSIGFSCSSGKGNLESFIFNPASTLNPYITIIIDLNNQGLSDIALNNIFTLLPDLSSTTSKTIVITDCIGANSCDQTIATSKNWTIIN